MNKQKRIVSVGLGGLLVAFAVFVLAKSNLKPTAPQTSPQIHVVASFYPLYYFAKQIAGSRAEIINVTPAGAEPHDYEPSVGDIAQIEKSDLLILNGGGLEIWADKISSMLKKKKIVVVDAAGDLITQEIEQEGTVVKDPHVWLDPVLAQKEVAKILQGLSTVDPVNKSLYEANTQQLTQKLQVLDQAFSAGLKNCQQKNIVTSHAAFGYVASRYNLKQVPISGISPDSEPTPKQLAGVAQFAKSHQVSYIFFETLVSPKLAQTLAQEVGAKTLVFDPLEGLTKEEENRGVDYFSIQNENLMNLKTALQCL